MPKNSIKIWVDFIRGLNFIKNSILSYKLAEYTKSVFFIRLVSIQNCADGHTEILCTCLNIYMLDENTKFESK